MSYYSHGDIDELNSAIDRVKRLLSDKMKDISDEIKASNQNSEDKKPLKTYTSDDVYELLDCLYNEFEFDEAVNLIDNIDDKIKELEDENSEYEQEHINRGSMREFKNLVLDNLPESASLADRNEIEEKLSQCECLK